MYKTTTTQNMDNDMKKIRQRRFHSERATKKAQYDKSWNSHVNNEMRLSITKFQKELSTSW